MAYFLSASIPALDAANREKMQLERAFALRCDLWALSIRRATAGDGERATMALLRRALARLAGENLKGNDRVGLKELTTRQSNSAGEGKISNARRSCGAGFKRRTLRFLYF